MPRNVEIKARATAPARQRALAAALADSGPATLEQEDTFFHCPTGRLKVRAFPDGAGELIHYRRPDAAGPKASEYAVVPTPDAAALTRALAAALGVRGVVRKTRTVYLVGQTRIHLDQVDGLGPFIELEVVLGPDDPAERGAAVAADLMKALEIGRADLVEGAYIDLLLAAEAGGRV